MKFLKENKEDFGVSGWKIPFRLQDNGCSEKGLKGSMKTSGNLLEIQHRGSWEQKLVSHRDVLAGTPLWVPSRASPCTLGVCQICTQSCAWRGRGKTEKIQTEGLKMTSFFQKPQEKNGIHVGKKKGRCFFVVSAPSATVGVVNLRLMLGRACHLLPKGMCTIPRADPKSFGR